MKKIFVLLFVFGLVVPSLYAKTFNFKIVEDLIYDDNIYYTDKDTEGSFLSSTKLYANFLSKIPSTSINVDANAHVGYNAYTEDFYNNSYMDAGLDLKLNNRFFDFRESFTYTSDPANNSFNERAERINNDVYLGYTSNKEKKLGFGVYAQDILDDYLKERYEYLNRNRVNLGAKLFYNFNPKKSVYLGYQYSNIDYSKNTFNNSNGNSYFLGATGEITAKIKGTAQVSYDDRHYNKKYEDSLENGNLIGFLADVTYKPFYSTTISLLGQRKMEETFFANNRYYISTNVNLAFKQLLFRKWTFGLAFGYENMEYPISVEGMDRDDNYFTFTPSVDFKVKDILSIGVWYQNRNRLSNMESKNYLSNKTGVRVAVFF